MSLFIRSTLLLFNFVFNSLESISLSSFESVLTFSQEFEIKAEFFAIIGVNVGPNSIFAYSIGFSVSIGLTSGLDGLFIAVSNIL